MIITIDPGPTESAILWFRPNLSIRGEILPNDEVLARITCDNSADHLVIEQVASYGMSVGQDVFETVFWSGRFAEAFGGDENVRWHRLKRLQVKMHLCHDSRANDSNIRQALLDRLGPVGTKKNPGPCYGIKKHLWAALALAITWTDLSWSTINEASTQKAETSGV
jgi:hypothetical protein